MKKTIMAITILTAMYACTNPEDNANMHNDTLRDTYNGQNVNSVPGPNQEDVDTSMNVIDTSHLDSSRHKTGGQTGGQKK